MNDTAEAPASIDRIGQRIEQVCADIDLLLAQLREQARTLKEIGDDERR